MYEEVYKRIVKRLDQVTFFVFRKVMIHSHHKNNTNYDKETEIYMDIYEVINEISNPFVKLLKRLDTFSTNCKTLTFIPFA